MTKIQIKKYAKLEFNILTNLLFCDQLSQHIFVQAWVLLSKSYIIVGDQNVVLPSTLYESITSDAPLLTGTDLREGGRAVDF